MRPPDKINTEARGDSYGRQLNQALHYCASFGCDPAVVEGLQHEYQPFMLRDPELGQEQALMMAFGIVLVLGPVGEDDEYYPSLLPERSTNSRTTGILVTDEGAYLLKSGYNGPAADMPKGTPGFNNLVRGHVEGHAAAMMRQQGISNATLYINNVPCRACQLNIRYMLPEGARLRVVGPQGIEMIYYGAIK